jgi:uncharacterized membrane protein
MSAPEVPPGYDARDARGLAVFALVLGAIVATGATLSGVYGDLLTANWRPALDLAPLSRAGPATLVHLAAGAVSLSAVAAILSLPKGTRLHKVMGWTFAVAVTIAVTTTLLLNPRDLNGTKIAALSALAILPFSIRAVRRGNVRLHRVTMAILALVCAINFTLALMPGRTMHAVLFASAH